MSRRNKLVSLLLVISLLISFAGCSKKPEDETPEDPIRAYGYYTNNSSYSQSWSIKDNTRKLDATVAAGSREKRTEIRGDGKDEITIMVFMCGADLESKNAMGSYDLQEMATANIADNVNLLVYTGGCKSWHINGISNSVNQILQVVGNGNIQILEDNAGSGKMTSPDTLESFIEYSVNNFEANRYALIFWDHGSGSVGGYGYDEKYPSSAPMSFAEIDQALTNADVYFDFIGFDCCLMATLENALMLTQHADYLIASEESEPGIGWFYTNWLSKLSGNTSMATTEIGKNIIDDFVSTSATQVPSQAATLSLVDLAELENTIPSRLTAFANSANQMLENNQYRTIAAARSGAREFASSQKIDLVDLVDMAGRIDTPEAKELTNALLGCIKYNNASASMSNSYGLSIYFPYRSTKYINNVLKNYDEVEMNKEYVSVVRNFASYQVSGQSASGGYNTPSSSLSGTQSSSSYTNQNSADALMQLFGLLLNSQSPAQQQQQTTSYDPYAALIGYGLQALFGRDNLRNVAEYIVDNHFDADLNWKNGKIALTKEQWELVEDLKLNVFVDDGDCYIDLGCDNLYEIDDDGNLLMEGGDTWLAMSCDQENWSVIPYYYICETVGENDTYTIYGRVPVRLNGDYADLIVVFDDKNPKGYVAGATYSYEDNVSVAKNLTELQDGDVLDFLCDCYSYDGEFIGSSELGEAFTVNGTIHIGDIDISDYDSLSTYQFTDIYQQNYWTAPMKK